MTIFSSKIDALIDTAETAVGSVDSTWSAALLAGKSKPVVAVGSGGSAITATFLGACRRTLGFSSTQVQTPLEYLLEPPAPNDQDTWFFSGSGDNTDILAAFNTALVHSGRDLFVVTSRPDGTLARQADSEGIRTLIACTRGQKDGFLTTHSLIAAVTVLLVTAERIAHSDTSATASGKRFGSGLQIVTSRERRDEMRDTFSSIRPETVLLILHDPRLAAAAVALETSLWEAALCPVQTVDFRNFAHGRHVLPASQPARVFVLALTGFETRDMWEETARQLPEEVGRYHVDFADCGRHQCALAIATALTIVEAVGLAVGIDPAKPLVSTGGRALFDSSAAAGLAAKLTGPVRSKASAIYRYDDADANLRSPFDCYTAYVKAISETEIGGLVLDFDGTLVPTKSRTDPIGEELAALLNTRLDEGLKLGIATGRGSSVRNQLLTAVHARHRRNVIVGYYNGAVLKSLIDDPQTDMLPIDPCISAARAWLMAQGISESDIRTSPVQLTFARSCVKNLADFSALLRADGHTNVRLVQSGHSVDLCLASSSKTKVIGAMQLQWELAADTILSAGDSGGPTGNDFELLGSSLGVAVGEMCGRPAVGWPLFGSDVTGPEAVLRLLRAMDPTSKAGRFKIKLT